MIVRVLAALVGLAVLVPALIFGGSLAVHLLVPPALALCCYEYARMAFPDRWKVALAWMFPAMGVIYGTALYLPELAWLGYGLTLVATAVFVVLRPGPSLELAFAWLGRYAFGMSWLGLLAFLPMIRDLPHGLAWVFIALGAAWFADTGAYFAGRLFGRRKLHEQLSPKKTVEGFVGGLVTCVAGVMLIAHFFIPDLPLLEAAALALIAGTLGVLGDLAESLVKRATGVKDAGSIMPGHGGLLDRIDSLLFVAPAVYGFAVIVVRSAP
ncbi:MAG: phosphatidate cytidylyltransferase [Deltaproteobacteria bacterium]|nr:MAG: phosphatidate cytidylyltransferase [Deltaproteobacteria bacterium]